MVETTKKPKRKTKVDVYSKIEEAVIFILEYYIEKRTEFKLVITITKVRIILVFEVPRVQDSDVPLLIFLNRFVFVYVVNFKFNIVPFSFSLVEKTEVFVFVSVINENGKNRR